MKQRWELERLEEERKQMAALRRKAELGCVGQRGSAPLSPGPLLSHTCIGAPEARGHSL